MILKVVSTGSKGNCYILAPEKGRSLMIECGINSGVIKRAIDFNPAGVAGCLLTHEHNDHAKGIEDVAAMGINIYATKQTFEARGVEGNRYKNIRIGEMFHIDQFAIAAFPVMHDAAEPVGFLINHKECGKVVFITDTYYVPNRFRNLNNIIIEANYCEDIINQKIGIGSDKKFLRDRIIQSHFSIQNCLEFLAANDLSGVNNIVLIHLSDNNSSEPAFKKAVESLTQKTVHIAKDGLTIELNITPF